MKLKMFEADAVVLGKSRAVQFREGGLMLTGLTYEEAMEVLRLTGPKTTPVGGVGDQQRPAPTPEKHQQKESPRSSEDRVSAPVKEAAKPAPAKDDSPPFEPDAPPSKTELKLAAELEGKPEPGSDGAEVPKKIAESTRFYDVLEWVLAVKKLKKTAPVDEIVAAFGELKLGAVPAVRRVRDLKDKVASTIEAYAEAGDAA